MTARCVAAHRLSSSQAPSFRESRRPAAVGKCPPPSEGAKRRQALVRNAAPVGSPCGKARPFSGREQPAHNADRRAYRRLAAAFSLDLGTAFWKRTGAPIRTPLIPRAFASFHPLHQPVAGRTHVVGPGDVSRSPRRPGWLGRALRRRPCSANKRHRLAPSASRDGWNIVAVGDGNQAGVDNL